MPAKQHGNVIRRGKVWQARWIDDEKQRHARSGFASKSLAREFLKGKVDEVEKLRRGERLPDAARPTTVNALVDLFLEKHGRTVDPATEAKLRRQLKHARAEFGDRHPDSLTMPELEDWRETLSPGARHDVFRAFRQALTWAVKRGKATRDATAGIENPKRKRHERRDVLPFESWEEVEAVAAELDPRYRTIPVVLVGTGLRPEELFGLNRDDVDRERRILHVRRRYTGGVLKEGTKTVPERRVQLRAKVLEALDAMPTRIDTPVLFPAPRGGRIDLEKFRHREWAPALRAAGLPHHRVYDCRHTFATWAIRDGVRTLQLAMIMGTSVGQIEDTYFRWLASDDDNLRDVFDRADMKEAVNA